ncbi:MAG: rod-binding protein [Clostridia bacterium]|nr:rod-binding protein [Clostridia bacterium]MDD4047890.1 rod-binding protein [Clostridia bacterium]
MIINSLNGINGLMSKNNNVITDQKEESFKKIFEKAKNEKDDKKLRTVCQEIEELFIHQMIKQMRATIPKSELMPESTATKIYNDMLDSEYSKQMAKSNNNIGIADVIYKQIKR